MYQKLSKTLLLYSGLWPKKCAKIYSLLPLISICIFLPQYSLIYWFGEKHPAVNCWAGNILPPLSQNTRGIILKSCILEICFFVALTGCNAYHAGWLRHTLTWAALMKNHHSRRKLRPDNFSPPNQINLKKYRKIFLMIYRACVFVAWFILLTIGPMSILWNVYHACDAAEISSPMISILISIFWAIVELPMYFTLMFNLLFTIGFLMGDYYVYARKLRNINKSLGKAMYAMKILVGKRETLRKFWTREKLSASQLIAALLNLSVVIFIFWFHFFFTLTSRVTQDTANSAAIMLYALGAGNFAISIIMSVGLLFFAASPLHSVSTQYIKVLHRIAVSVESSKNMKRLCLYLIRRFDPANDFTIYYGGNFFPLTKMFAVQFFIELILYLLIFQRVFQSK